MAGQKSEESVLIVPVSEYSFKRLLKDLVYVFPASYGLRIPPQVAFYRTSPVSAITHIAVVEEVRKDVELSMKDRLMMFGDHVLDPATAVKFRNARKLDRPIPANQGKGIQGRMYRTCKELESAESISDLFEA